MPHFRNFHDYHFDFQITEATQDDEFDAVKTTESDTEDRKGIMQSVEPVLEDAGVEDTSTADDWAGV